jgi:CBS domain-containing protein
MGAVIKILERKGNAIYSVSPETKVFRALELMVEKNVSALLVMEADKLLGMFTEKDYAHKVALHGKSSKQTIIKDVMTPIKITVEPGHSIDHCMVLMTANFTRHLPVIDDDKLIGIVSIGDVLKHIIEEQKFIIENMEHYIAGQ